jgi:hypothetical protein
MTTENPKNPRMALKLDEANTVRFKLSIQGTVSDPTQTQPVVRFVVTENKSGVAWLFPLQRGNEDNLFVSTIPNMPSAFSETKDYTGRVEVIVGGRYFNPTTVNIAFERELTVEGSAVLTEEQEPTDKEVDDIFGVIKPDTNSKILREKKTQSPEAALINDVLFSKHKQEPVTVAESPKTKPAVQLQKKPVTQKKSLTAIVEEKVPRGGREKYKNKLKSLIAEAWEEMDS